MKYKNAYLGLALGIVSGTTVLPAVIPVTNSVINVYAAEGESVEVASYDEFYDAIVNGSAATVKLAGDITDVDETKMIIAAERTVTIDLDGHTLTIRGTKDRGIVNYGTLKVTGGGLIRNSSDETANNSYGLIDNYGNVAIEDTMLIDYGTNSGATVKNRVAAATMTIGENVVINATVEETSNAAISVDNGTVTISDGAEISSTSTTFAAIFIVNGNVTIGETVNSLNPVVISGGKHGIEVDNGTTTINNATITTELKYGLYILGSNGRVIVNSADIQGNSYGAYVQAGATLDEAILTIHDGTFAGTPRAVLATNGSSTVQSWAIDIDGGTYADKSVRSYLVDGKVAYEANGAYVVDDEVTNSLVPQTLYVKVGTQANLNLSALQLKYATTSLDKDNIIILDGNTITSGKTGIVTITTDLNDGSEPITTTVYSYENLLSVSLVDADHFSDEEIAALEAELLEGEKKVGYLDVSYARVIDGVEIERITETTEPVTILVEMPELPELAEGYQRSYRVLHYHNGSVEEISEAHMNNDGTVGFETSTFSPFLVVYSDTEIPTPEPDPNEEDYNIVPKDDTFDYNDEMLDPLGETYTQAAASGETSSNGSTAGVPNTGLKETILEEGSVANKALYAAGIGASVALVLLMVGRGIRRKAMK